MQTTEDGSMPLWRRAPQPELNRLHFPPAYQDRLYERSGQHGGQRTKGDSRFDHGLLTRGRAGGNNSQISYAFGGFRSKSNTYRGLNHSGLTPWRSVENGDVLNRMRAYSQQIDEAKKEIARRVDVKKKVHELKKKLQGKSLTGDPIDPVKINVSTPDAVKTVTKAKKSRKRSRKDRGEKRKRSSEPEQNATKEKSPSLKTGNCQEVELIVRNLKSVILKKSRAWLTRLIDDGTTRSTKSVIMSRLVKEHRSFLTEQLNATRFRRRSETFAYESNDGVAALTSAANSSSLGEVDLNNLPDDLITCIEEMIKEERPELCNNGQKDAEDDDVMEVPVPPKPPAPLVTLESDEEMERLNENEPEKMQYFMEGLMGPRVNKKETSNEVGGMVVTEPVKMGLEGCGGNFQDWLSKKQPVHKERDGLNRPKSVWQISRKDPSEWELHIDGIGRLQEAGTERPCERNPEDLNELKNGFLLLEPSKSGLHVTVDNASLQEMATAQQSEKQPNVLEPSKSGLHVTVGNASLQEMATAQQSEKQPNVLNKFRKEPVEGELQIINDMKRLHEISMVRPTEKESDCLNNPKSVSLSMVVPPNQQQMHINHDIEKLHETALKDEPDGLNNTKSISEKYRVVPNQQKQHMNDDMDRWQEMAMEDASENETDGLNNQKSASEMCRGLPSRQLHIINTMEMLQETAWEGSSENERVCSNNPKSVWDVSKEMPSQRHLDIANDVEILQEMAMEQPRKSQSDGPKVLWEMPMEKAKEVPSPSGLGWENSLQEMPKQMVSNKRVAGSGQVLRSTGKRARKRPTKLVNNVETQLREMAMGEKILFNELLEIEEQQAKIVERRSQILQHLDFLRLRRAEVLGEEDLRVDQAPVRDTA